nr:E3 ubiquitin-protein ligase Praja-2-like [Ipomoea batatas]
MEEDYSDYDVFYSVRPYPTDSFDCRGASSAASHIHVRFSHRTADDIDDDGGEYEVESRTVCVGDELLEEGSEVDCGNFIYSELPFYWPIHGDILQEIFDEVIEKAREFKCTLRVDIRTVHIRDYEEDRDFGAAAEGVNNGAAPVASDGMSVVKSLKRKRIEEGGESTKLPVVRTITYILDHKLLATNKKTLKKKKKTLMEWGIIDNFSNNGPISSAVQLYRPINAGTLTAIAGEVIDRICRFVRSVAVRIRSIWSYNADYNSDSDSDLLLDDEEVITHISEDDSVLDDEEEITYFSDDDDSVLDDGEVTYLSDDEEVTYLSYASGEAYPRIVTVIYGENSGAVATRGGVDQKRRQAIKSLERKIIEYDKTDCGGEIGGCCVICLEELTAGTEVAVMPCNHCSFHDRCLSTWLERSLCCPLCRHKIPGPPLPEPSLEM